MTRRISSFLTSVAALVLFGNCPPAVADHPLVKQNSCGEIAYIQICNFFEKPNLAPPEFLSGTCSMKMLLDAFKEAGISAQPKRANIAFLREQQRPFILHLTMEKSYSHFAVVRYDQKAGKFQSYDPVLNDAILSFEDGPYKWTGYVITF